MDLVASVIGLVLIALLLMQEMVHRKQLQDRFMEGFRYGKQYADELKKREEEQR